MTDTVFEDQLRRALDRIADEVPNGVAERVRARRYPVHGRPPATATIAVAVAVAALVAAFATGPFRHRGTGGGPQPAATPRGDGASVAAGSSSRERIVFDNMVFQLPGGFHRSPTGCAVAATASWATIPMIGSSFVAAANAQGGCLQASLVDARDVQFASAPLVAIGPYPAYVVHPTASETTLLIETPTAGGVRDLALTATGLTTDQLETIARSGLPGAEVPSAACSQHCG